LQEGFPELSNMLNCRLVWMGVSLLASPHFYSILERVELVMGFNEVWGMHLVSCFLVLLLSG